MVFIGNIIVLLARTDNGKLNLLDDAILNVDVSVLHSIIVDNPSILDEQAILGALQTKT